MKLKFCCQLTSVPFLLGSMAISAIAFMSYANAQNQPEATEREPQTFPRGIDGTIENYVEPTTTPTQNDDITTQAVATPANNVATFNTTIVRNPFVFGLYDYNNQDGDKVAIFVNGRILNPDVSLTSTPQYFNTRGLLGPGVNRIEIVSVSQGTEGPTTLGIRYEAEQVYDKAAVIERVPLDIGQSFNTTVGYPQIALCQTVLVFPCTTRPYPESALHVLEALGNPPEPITARVKPRKTGNPLRNRYPRLLTIERAGRDARRTVSTDPYECPNSRLQDKDEYPPATFGENNGSAHIKCIARGDNRGAGNSFGTQQLNNYKVTDTSRPVRLQNGDVIEFVILR